MKRVNGYLDIEEYFKRKLDEDEVELDVLSTKGLIKPEFGGVNSMFWFEYFGVDVLFKSYDDEYNRYSELISEELAKYLGLKNAQYDLASYGNLKGVISYDFKDKNHTYITLDKILDHYIDKLNLLNTEDESNTYGEHYLRKYDDIYDHQELVNNLEDVWNAIEFYLYDKNEVPKELIPGIVEKVMAKLTNYFSYQLITGNFEMHSGNILLAFKKDFTDIDLAPLYDNENMYGISRRGYLYDGFPRFSLSRESRENTEELDKVLKDYLSISDEYFVDRFKLLFYQLDADTIYEIMERVENKIEIKIPNRIKVQVASGYRYFYNGIKATLENKNIQK